jgi:hypothetical protein
MGGGLMQLVAYGVQDVYLTGNPQITFFKSIYRKHTNFSMECIKQSLKGTVSANSRVVATISRNGDLVHDCFIKMPAHTAEGQNEGHNIFDYIEVEIGGQLIDKHYGHWMEAHAELTEGIAGAIEDATVVTMNAATGSPVNTTDHQSSPFQKTANAGGMQTKSSALADSHIPLRFWFCRHVGLALPLIALQYHEVNIIVKFSGASTNATNQAVSLWCNYIYLDTDERRRFAQVSHEYLIEQVQTQSFTTNTSGDNLELNFNHPVKELVWAVTGTSTASHQWGGADGGYFFTLASVDAGSDKWQLKLNGHDRFEKQSLTYFTRYQPYKYHNGRGVGMIADGAANTNDSIAVYSFALKPEEHQPSGTCNFSRIDNARLIYDSGHASNGGAPLFVYAVNYNVLRIMSGMGGLAYSN